MCSARPILPAWPLMFPILNGSIRQGVREGSIEPTCLQCLVHGNAFELEVIMPIYSVIIRYISGARK